MLRNIKKAIMYIFLVCFIVTVVAAEDEKDYLKPYTNSLGIKMVSISAGSFQMGSLNLTDSEMLGGPPLNPQGDWDEHPAHSVTLTRPFYISQTEVTIDQFRQFRKDYRGTDAMTPYAAGLSWEECTAFCRWLSKKEDKPYRLPTEAEWEYVCRAGTETLFWSGDMPPEPGKDINPWHVSNMHSEVSEWCYDWHGMYPNQSQTDPIGLEKGVARIIRGGGLETHKKLGEFTAFYRRSANRAGLIPDCPSPKSDKPTPHCVGFRIVQAPLPATKPLPSDRPFPQQCVKQDTAGIGNSIDEKSPYFKIRPLLPVPPDNDQTDATEAVGLHPGIGPHLHSAGMTVCDNGDLLWVAFSCPAGFREHGSETVMTISRLRFGAEQWDMPALFYDLPDLNDQASLLWNDGCKIWLFAGGRHLQNVPFRSCTSTDNGATWSPLKTPLVTGEVGGFTPQPISSAFRGQDGAIYFASDGIGASSFLWCSDDEGRTWQDTGGRTAGRHSAIVKLKDGRLLSMGGKSSDINGYMPKCYSSDGGKTWSKPVETPFAALGSNQRPSLLRLTSGRLFFLSDFQQIRIKKKAPPEGITERGSFVAISDDEGQNWIIKKLNMATSHETRAIPDIKLLPWGTIADHDDSTIGYSVAAQAPDGLIHVITSTNHPSLHFSFNEAWILSDEINPINEDSGPGKIAPQREVIQRAQYDEDGKLKSLWHGCIAENGVFVLNGPEIWYYDNGQKQYEVLYANGHRVGNEVYFDRQGQIQWQRQHDKNGFNWIHYWPNGQKRIESYWVNFVAEGEVVHYDQQGKIINQGHCENGYYFP